MDTPPPAGRKRLVATFWAAVALSLLLHFSQEILVGLGLYSVQLWGRYLLLPFVLLSTWAHEMGHGLTAIAVGGDFDHLVLRSDMGGYAVHRGVTGFFGRPLVSMGGLLGPSVAGGAVIVAAARSEKACRVVLYVLVGALAVSLLVWIRPFFSFGFVAMLVIGAALAGLALKARDDVKLFVTQFIGIQLCLGSLQDIDYMFTHSFQRDGETRLSDTAHIAEHWWLPYWFWGALITVLSLAILVGAFYVAWIRPYRIGKPGAGDGGAGPKPADPLEGLA